MIPGEDGYELCYRVWPSAAPATGTIVLVSGMMSHSGWFRDLAFRLANLQLDVVGADRRGSGLNNRGRGDAPSRRILLSDLRRITEAEETGAPIYVLGWCWGALPVLNLALDLGRRLSGIALLAPGLFPSPAIRRAVQKQIVAFKAADDDAPVIPSPVTPEMFSDTRVIQDFIEHDYLAQRGFTRRFFRISNEMSLVATERLKQLAVPVLLLLAEYDAAVENQQTLAAVQRLPGTTLAGAMLACNHGMQFEVPREIVSHISQWLGRTDAATGARRRRSWHDRQSR